MMAGGGCDQQSDQGEEKVDITQLLIKGNKLATLTGYLLRPHRIEREGERVCL